MAADDQATRIWTGLRTVLFDLEDRRREVAAALDMSYLRAKAVLHLAPGPKSMRALAQDLLIDASYTTVIVDDLESRGYVTRTVNAEDKRTKIVAITEAGAAAAGQAQAVLDRPPLALLALPAKDLAALDRIVATLLAELAE